VGVTRDTVMQLAQAFWNVETIERRVNRTELWKADEVFLTGTAHEIAPVVEIDGRQVGNGSIGPFTSLLRDAYARAVKNTLWLTEGDPDEGWSSRLFAGRTTPVYAAQKG
jgi:branched-chain amino acid aminotransferase